MLNSNFFYQDKRSSEDNNWNKREQKINVSERDHRFVKFETTELAFRVLDKVSAGVKYAPQSSENYLRDHKNDHVSHG